MEARNSRLHRPHSCNQFTIFMGHIMTYTSMAYTTRKCSLCTQATKLWRLYLSFEPRILPRILNSLLQFAPHDTCGILCICRDPCCIFPLLSNPFLSLLHWTKNLPHSGVAHQFAHTFHTSLAGFLLRALDNLDLDFSGLPILCFPSSPSLIRSKTRTSNFVSG